MASIAEDGLEKTTMRNVAQRAGVSTGTLAYYFRDKEDLVDAALLDASEQYMERFRTEQRPLGPAALEHLVERFLAPDNTDAAFVLQMIEVGLHNSQLRGTHQEMIEAGRERIRRSIEVGVDTGKYRSDIDPKLAAALLHGVLIWWGSELIWNATSEDLAVEASRLALHLLEVQPANPGAGNGRPRSTIDSVRALLLADPRLTPEAAMGLADAVEKLYAVLAPTGGESQNGGSRNSGS
jgi:TetR/AcrR family fatty acid metabolism transcriptional regulator